MRPISPDLLNKLKSQEQTKANNADPRMSIQVSRARTSVMDSSYWTMETIRTKAGIGDISLAARRLKSYGRPDRIYEIHVDNGIVRTTIREYPDRQKDGWQPQFELGAGSAVAIAFDGEWELWRGNWRLKTTEKPWIMWVDGTGKLFAQLWDEVETRVELATGVVKVKAMRGWKNFSIQANDQGIVAAYIKSDGKVYYRNYCQQPDGTIAWEAERQLAEFVGTAANLNLFLTNDYRMGFVVEDSLGKVYWYITHRNWSGMAIPPEYLSAGITDITFDVIPINYYDAEHVEYLTTGITDVWFNVAEPIYPAPIFAENPDGSEVQLLLRFNHEIDYDLTQVLAAFSVKDSTDALFSVDTATAGADNSEIIFNMPNFAGASGNMFIVYDRSVIELDCLNQGSRFTIESFSFEFTPDLAPPEGHLVENLTVGITDISFVVSQVHYIDSYTTENLTAAIADISFVVTKIGSNPL